MKQIEVFMLFKMEKKPNIKIKVSTIKIIPTNNIW